MEQDAIGRAFVHEVNIDGYGIKWEGGIQARIRMTELGAQRAWLKLALLAEIPLKAKLSWLAAFGTPAKVLAQSVAKLREHAPLKRPLAELVSEASVDTVLNWSAETGGRCVFIGDRGYPPRLLERLAEPPLVLYLRGDPAVLDSPIVALAGTPQPTAHSAELARTLAYELGSEAKAVAAGVSRGIANQAHQGTLAANGQALGVVGNSSSWEGLRLVEEIAAAGVVVSELAPRVANPKLGYARRHRLLAALADLLLVVEAPLSCDTLRLAGEAAHMACEVAAVPASPSNPKGRGCNALIREGAALVESSADAKALL